MGDMDEVQRLIARTRANREKLNRHLNDLGESPHPVRSPLREKNATDLSKSPAKLSRSVTFTKSPPKRETYTKTTITEREEKIHKTEHISFSEIVHSNADKEAVIKSIASSHEKQKDDDDCIAKEEVITKSVTETRVSPTSPSKTVVTSTTVNHSPKRNLIKTVLSSPSKIETEPIVTSSNRVYKGYDEEVFGASGRKKRLAALAKRFNRYDEEDEDKEKSFTNPLDVTKEVDVDEEIASINKEKEINKNESSKKVLRKDPQFVKSLKAQGFEESGSKSKLVYNFSNNEGSSPQRRATILSSPTKTAAEPRETSPHKPHPLQFISPQVNQSIGSSPIKNSVAPKSMSPGKSQSERPVSPHKPHPLQFISPQVNKSISHCSKLVGSPKGNKRAASPVKNMPISDPPAKPARSWATDNDDSTSSKVWYTGATKNITVTPSHSFSPAPPPPPKLPSSDPKTDTASRRSMAEKWSMFEKKTAIEVSPSVDPAVLTLSEKRALFEKNRYVPKPIARFGDAVTPSMLQKGQPFQKTNAPSKQPFVTPKRGASPLKHQPSPKRKSPDKSPEKIKFKTCLKGAMPKGVEDQRGVSPKENYPGVNSLKRVKLSPPKPGQLYPQIMESGSEENERPSIAMSNVSQDPSEALSLGAVIKQAATSYQLLQHQQNAMPSISESSTDEHEDLDVSIESQEIEDILDEALDDTESSFESTTKYRKMSSSPRRWAPSPKRQIKPALSPTASACSWEFQTPVQHIKRGQHDFRTPLVEGVEQSPQSPFPEVEGEEGSSLFHSVSFYRRQRPSINVTPHQKIVRYERMAAFPEGNEKVNYDPTPKIIELEKDMAEQKQRMTQASKALDYCVSKGEFEGSSERVEGERLLLESTLKYHAAKAECNRLKTKAVTGKGKSQSSSTGSISISGLSLPLKPNFLKMLKEGLSNDTIHFFVVLIKYRNRVIATQMLSTLDGISRNGKLTFPNLINLRELDFDFQINLEVYGLQTKREHLAHDVKYHIKKEKSMFQLTPLKKLKKQDSSPLPRNSNPVSSSSIRHPAFGMVGYAVINIDTLKQRAFTLDKVPEMSPLEGGLEMTLTIHSESRIELEGFLNLFADGNGYGDWCSRHARLEGNFLNFWKNKEDKNRKEPCFQVDLSSCVTSNVTKAPREVCSRMNTFMLETKRRSVKGDQDSLVMRVNRKTGTTIIRHLLSADSRDNRIAWCAGLNKALGNLRAWDPNAMRPRSDSRDSQTSTSTAVSSTCTDIW